MADTVGSMKREHAGSDQGSTETADNGPSEDEGRSRRSLDNRFRSVHHYEANANSVDLSDPSGTGDTLSVDTTNTNLSTETSSSNPFHRHLDGSSLSSRSRYLGTVGSQLVIEEVHTRGSSYDQSDFDSSPYSRRSGRLPGQPFPTGPSWWIGYPSTVRREKEREREERVRVAREKLAEERKKKIEEFKEQQRLAQQHRERQQELRRRKIDELRRREEERRAAVEERRRKQEEEQRARREAIIQKAQERVARYEQWKQQGRHREWSDSLPAIQGSYPASVPPSKHLSVSTSVLYYKRSPEFSSTGTLNSSNRPESLLALNTIPEKRRSFLAPATPQRPKSTIGLHMSSSSASGAAKPREMRTPRKPRPASIAGTMPGFVPLDVPKSSTPRSKSSERISKDKPRNRSSTTDSVKSDKSAGSTTSTQSKSSRKAIFDRLSTPKKPTEAPKKNRRVSEKKSSTPTSGTTTPPPRKTKTPSKEKGARESPNREGIPSLPEDLMTRSTPDMMSRSTQDITEEEYKLKLAEKRRQAREKAEREAELERQRQEELRRQEEERLRLEEEEQRRLEEESIRLAEEARKAEEERLRKAIEAEEQRKKEEAERLEVERKQKEEAERKAKEEAERLEKERIERAKKEEEERLARKKRLEMIMKRVKTDPVADSVRQDSPSKSLQSSPSRSSNSSTEISPDEKPDEELHPSAPVEDNLNKASSQEDVRSSGDEEKSAAKFKSPLLKQLMDKRNDDSSTDGSPKFKSPILQNILGKSKTNLGNRLLKTGSSEKLGSSQESLDQPISDNNIYSAKDVERRKSDADKDDDTVEGNHMNKQKSLNRLSVSFDQSVGMEDSGFADSNGSTKVPQIDVNGTSKAVELSSEPLIGSLVNNDLDNREKAEHSTIPGALSWAVPNNTSAPVSTAAPTHQPGGGDIAPIPGVCDTTTLASSAKCSQDEINPLIDLSVANKNIDLKSQQLQDNLRNNSDDLLNFNSINVGTGDHSPLIPFEDNATQRQDVTEFI